MNTWFTVKIQYDKVTERGRKKKATESYLVDAMTFTEVEARITGELATYGKDISVLAISRTNIQETFNSDKVEYDKWYKVKFAYEAIGAKGKKSRKRCIAMIKSDCTFTAERDFHERMKGSAVDYVVEAIEETNIIDVYPYALERETDKTR